MAVRLTTPVTIITGFLGSGKTSLINRILRETHGQKIAVIENEFGEVGVDAEFLASTGEETIIQLANGCVCCTVRGDLALALQQLAEQSDAGNFSFDKVIIETTGIADPGPIIQTFLAETAIEERFHIDGVVTLVDLLNGINELELVENRAQIAYADRILMTKSDLVGEEQIQALSNVVSSINPAADQIICNVATIDIEKLLNHLFEIRGLALDYVPPDEIRRARGIFKLASSEEHAKPTEIGSKVLSRHTTDVISGVFCADESMNLTLLNQFIDMAIARFGSNLWRCKGIVYSQEHRSRLIVQGVQGLIQISGGTLWRAFEKKQTTLVFIGTSLDMSWILKCLDLCKESVSERDIEIKI